MIQHVAYEIDRDKVAEELLFWSMLGFNPTGLRRLSRKQPPIHWLVCGDESHAVELLPVDRAAIQGLSHVAYAVSQRQWEITLIKARQGANFQIKTYEKGLHGFFEAPSGYCVELITYYWPVKAGPPLLQEAS